jgi:hypothetical protein
MKFVPLPMPRASQVRQMPDLAPLPSHAAVAWKGPLPTAVERKRDKTQRDALSRFSLRTNLGPDRFNRIAR